VTCSIVKRGPGTADRSRSARVEDAIRTGKDCGIGKYPSTSLATLCPPVRETGAGDRLWPPGTAQAGMDKSGCRGDRFRRPATGVARRLTESAQHRRKSDAIGNG